MDKKKRSIDEASQKMLEEMAEAGIKNAWDRYEAQEPQCGFGRLGICCRNCAMGPCRIDPFEEGPQEGVCGATADTIAARNLIRMIAAGAAAAPALSAPDRPDLLFLDGSQQFGLNSRGKFTHLIQKQTSLMS